MLKPSADKIEFLWLSHLICNSLILSIYPARWKTAVFKKRKRGSCYDVKNYQSISILPVFSKLFERLIHMQLQLYLTSTTPSLHTNIYGFQKSRSCQTLLLSLANRLFTARIIGNFPPCQHWYCLYLNKEMLVPYQIIGLYL